MISVVGTALLAAFVMQAPSETRQNRAPQTDQTVSATRGTRLVIDNYAGEVVVHGWEKDAVRVRARHNSRVKVNIRPGASVINVDAEASSGSARSVDYDINVPNWMPIKIEGHVDYVSVDGVQGELSIETVRGDVVLKNIGAAIAKTIEGAIQVDGAHGKLNLSSVNEDIKVSGATGDVVADTTNGEITLTHIESSSAEITTVNGDIAFEGNFASGGHYSFTNHNGDIDIAVPDHANATFNVRTYNGEFTASLPVKGPDPSQVRRGRRVSYTLGNGSAEVEVETFGGEIKLRRSGAARTRRDQ